VSLLTEGARDLPERQRTLRNTLDWSFGLLSPAGQALLSRLGVFPGAFDLEAAEAVGGAHGSAPAGQDQAGEIIDTLGSLVDASLVHDAERAGGPRFSLLETIREYARERLRESGQWNEAHDWHAAYFLELAESARAGLEGPGQVAWLDRLEAEHDNLGAAISWFLDQDRPGPALQLSGMTREGLSVASDAGDDSSVGYYLQQLAALARQRDDPGPAVRLLAAADALLQAAGTGWLVAYAAAAPSGDDTMPGLRSRMGDATFQQAWAQGAAMGRQRAVEYALQE